MQDTVQNQKTQLPTALEVKNLIRFYLGDEIGRTILIPILVNYAPIMHIGSRNYFLCVVVSPDSVTLGFSTEITSRGLIVTNIPYTNLQRYIDGSSLCNLSTDELLLKGQNNIVDFEFITSMGLQTIGTLSIVTSEFDYLKAIIADKATQDSTLDTILKYAIESQTRLDTFVRYFTGRRGEGNLPKFAEIRYVNHVMATNINITGDTSLLNCFQEHRGKAKYDVYIDEVLLSKKDDFSVKVIYPSFSNPTTIPNSYDRTGEYYITGLGFVRDDFGPGSISGIPSYTPTYNPYLIILMCNDKAFRHLYNDRRNSVYFNHYKTIEYPDLGVIIEYSSEGSTTFTGFLNGSAFLSRKG